MSSAAIALFGSSNCNEEDVLYKAAYDTGGKLAESGFDLINGGYSGIMEASFRGAYRFHVKRTGITTADYPHLKINEYANEEIKTNSYFERLIKLSELPDAFIVFEGGSGTLLELASVWMMKQRGWNPKPVLTLGRQWMEICDLLKDHKKLKNNEILNFLEIDKLVKHLINHFEKR